MKTRRELASVVANTYQPKGCQQAASLLEVFD